MTNGQTADLLKALKAHQVFETPEEFDHNNEVLIKLEELFIEWIREVAVGKHTSVVSGNGFGGKIIPYGPFSLNAHQRDTEIDALCVAPRSIEENEFLDSFSEYLKTKSGVARCSLVVLQECDPSIKVELEGTKVNLTFLRLSLKQIPEGFQLSEEGSRVTWHLGSKRSLNCCLTTEKIANLVPNLQTFQVALKAILLWARKHGIYSGTLGYFDGTTWAVLVARTCQLYPEASAATVVDKFFLVFLLWPWPKPVLLQDYDGSVGRSNHLMPVMTPTTSQQNLSLNVSEVAKQVILGELQRGMIATDDIMSGRLSWDHLFKTRNFLYRYRHFVVILVESNNVEDHCEWCSLVETKMCLLTIILERNPYITLVHVNSNPSHHQRGLAERDLQQSAATPCLFTSPFSTIWYIGLNTVSDSKMLGAKLKENMDFFKQLVLQSACGRIKEGTTIEILHVKP